MRKKIKATGARQVRLYKGWFYTYPYPAPRGYGTRGELIGIYDATATVKWIEADLMRALLSLASCAQADERL